MPTTLNDAGIVSRAAELERRELMNDLAASWPAPLSPRTAEAWLGRPAVLRRVAMLLAAQITDEIDRIIGVGRAAPVLATALGLNSGLPFAWLTRDSEIVGAVHAGEAVVLVASSRAEFEGITASLEALGVEVRARLCVADASVPEGGEESFVLFSELVSEAGAGGR